MHFILAKTNERNNARHDSIGKSISEDEYREEKYREEKMTSLTGETMLVA